MPQSAPRHRLLDIPLLEERYGSSFLASVAVHLLGAALFLFGPLLLPQRAAVPIGTGPGGGTGGATYTVGVVDELAGGAGMTKPSLVPQPPALPAEPPVKEEVKQEAVALPQTVEPKKAPKAEAPKAPVEPPKNEPPKKTVVDSNVIPTAPQPGAGGQGGISGGGGGGRGGGSGVSIGTGSGGLGDSYYARAVESRVSSNWIRPQGTARVEITYSFTITPSGAIIDIKREKSSGNELLDLTADRAIRASQPLPRPPPEFGGRPILFIAQFVHPPNP